MPAPNATTRSPPPAPRAGSSRTPSPPSPSSSSLHQVGLRQATRTRTRTRRNVSSSLSTSHRIPHYTHEDHPLSPHNLDRQGYHSFRCLGVPFHVKKRYIFLRELGIGAYGCVALCRDEVLDCNVAIKKVTRIFERDVLARRALREVAILRSIGMCDNVTALLDFDTTFIEFSEIYLVLSASEADLSQIIRSGQTLSDAHHQYFVAQILRGVRYMHAAKVVHRDLKPGNLLVNADCALRLCDFGLARAYADPYSGAKERCNNDDTGPATPGAVDERQQQQPQDPLEGHDEPGQARVADARDEGTAHLSRSFSPQSDLKLHTQRRDSKGKQRRLNYLGGPLTEYVATRWYRAPEVMLCFREGYGPELDMWGVGCILAELIGGQPIFPGKDYVDQITRINNILGSPPDSLTDKIGSERAKFYIKALPRMPAVPLQHLYPSASAEAVDLLSRLLTWDPAERLTADKALRHPWLKAYHESNARWQPPPAFDKFAEVEFIRSLREFKVGLQREADEVKQEIEALKMEEADVSHVASASPVEVEDESRADGVNEDGDRPQQKSESPQPSDTSPAEEQRWEADGSGDADADANVDEAGNGSRADASHEDRRSSTDVEQPAEACTSSCGTSTRSCHLPEALASESSADTLSSTETSGDEADPLSPRSFNGCRIVDGTNKAELQKEGALTQEPPFFRLGHEEEGRHPYPFDDDKQDLQQQQQARRCTVGDVFVPEDLLQVAQDLVQYQLDVAAAAGATATNEQTLGCKGDSFPTFEGDGRAAKSTRGSQPLFDSIAAADSGATPPGKGGARTGGTTPSRFAGGGVGAGTPSLGQGLLGNLAIVPASSSSGISLSSQRQSKQLVLVQDGLLQSSAALLAELIARGANKGQPTLLVSVLRHPSTYLRPRDVRDVTVLDGSSFCNGYAQDGEEDSDTLDLGSWKGIAKAVLAKLESMNTQARVTVMIDSLDTLAEQSGDGIKGAFNLIRLLLGRLNAFGRLVVGFQGDDFSVSAALVSALNTPLVWTSKASSGSAGVEGGDNGSSASAAAGGGGTILTARLHAPAVMRYIYRNYGFRPSSTPATVAKALASEASVASGTAGLTAPFIGFDEEDAADVEADVRFWDILRNIASRGALGIPAYESGGGTGGWWADGSVAGDEVECVFKSPNQTSSASRQGATQSAALHADRICFEDLIGSAAFDGESGRTPRSNGWGFLELKYQARSGKIYEELVGCVAEASSSHGRELRLRPLDMADRRCQSRPPSSSQPQSTRTAAGGGQPPSPAHGVSGPVSAAPADSHASMMFKLPFNLAETEAQRARREDVPLPYAFYQNSNQAAAASDAGQPGSGMRGSTGNSTIFFEPEAGDDEDDEDPDDDLDL